MSDRAYLAVTIYSCPPDRREAVRRLLADAEIVDGDQYAWEERVLGEDEDYARDLADISPDIAYQVRQDAKYEFDGRTTLRVPAMGTFTAPLSASGQVLVTREQALDAICAAGGNLPETLTAINALYGQPFTAALEALAAAAQAAPA